MHPDDMYLLRLAGGLKLDDQGRGKAVHGALGMTFNLLELPRELRDHIYEFVLVPDIPLEFAPIQPSVPHYEWNDLEHEEHGIGWHALRYELSVVPSLQLLQVNKQVNAEATPIFYAQPFRFSNQKGWVTLHHWLTRIGKENCALVKDITVCHPAWADPIQHDYYMGRLLEGNYHDFGLPTMQPLPFVVDKWESSERLPVDLPSMPGDTLAKLPELRNLRLLLHLGRRPEMWSWPIAEDEIMATAARLIPAGKVEVLHLLGANDTSNMEFSLEHELVKQDTTPAPSDALASVVYDIDQLAQMATMRTPISEFSKKGVIFRKISTTTIATIRSTGMRSVSTRACVTSCGFTLATHGLGKMASAIGAVAHIGTSMNPGHKHHDLWASSFALITSSVGKARQSMQ